MGRFAGLTMVLVIPQFWFWLNSGCYLAVAASPYTPPQGVSTRSNTVWKSFATRFLPSRRTILTKNSPLHFWERGGSFPSYEAASSSSWSRKERHNARRFDSQQEEASSSSDVENQNSFNYYNHDENVPGWKRVWQHVSPALPRGRQWARFVVSGVQIGLVLYLVGGMLQSLREALESVASDGSNSMERSLFSEDDVSGVLEHFRKLSEAASDGDTDAKESAVSASTTGRRGNTFTVALSLADLLLHIGMPLQSENSTAASVESVLSSISRSEANLLRECIWLRREPPGHMWNRIIGLQRVKQGLMSALATVTKQSSHSYTSLFDNSSAGVLLYGPPGCGKTMLAMSLSAMAKIPCLLITPAVLLNKYFGETNQRCRTLFSLASKLSPCIICIDELDGLFRKRSDDDHEATRSLKSEILQHWEGMSSHEVRNLIIGATNRPFDVDEAVLRRFTQSYFVDLPDKTGRVSILSHMLQNIPTAEDANVLATSLSEQTENYSPSDLRRLLQTAAALGPLRDSPNDPRPLTAADVQRALQGVSATPLTPTYRQSLASFVRSNRHSSPPRKEFSHREGEDDQRALLWESDLGNFYHLGSFPVDAVSFDLLTHILQRLSDDDDVDMPEWSDEEETDFRDTDFHDDDSDD